MSLPGGKLFLGLFFLFSCVSSISAVAAANIAALSAVTASSETPSTGQLAIKAVDGVIDGYPGDYTKEWATNGQGAGAWIRLTWPTAYTVDQIVLYDRKNTTEQILSGTLTFSDGSSVAVGTLDNLGAPKTVAFTPRTITWVQFTINSVKAGSSNIGLMEMEVDGVLAGINTAPQITAGPTASPADIGENQTSQLSVTATDPENDVLTYTWVPQSGTITGSGATVTFNPPAVTADTVVRIDLTVRDPGGLTATGFVNVTVRDVVQSSVNIAALSAVTASSETPSTGQLAIKAVDGVIDGYPGDYTKEWATNGQGAGAWIRLTWPTAYTVDQIVLYDRKNTTEQILSGTLTFSDGSSVAVGTLDNLGAPKTVAFTPRTITWVQFTINSVKAGSQNIGLMEMQAYGVASSRKSIMVVVAHPDDEALMAAGVMKRAHDNGDAVKVVIITNGDAQGKNAGLTREAESKTAVADKLGLSEDDIIFLGYPDSGLLPIYNDHPNATVPPYVKGSTGQSATYGNQGLGREDFHRYWTGAAADYNQANVVADLKELLNRYQPTQIYTHSPFDLHYDHRATYYDLRDAAQSLMKEQATFHPDVYTAIIHQPYLYPYKDKWAQGTTPTLSVLDDRDDQFWPLPAYGSVGTASGDLTLMKARFAPTQALTKPADLDLTLLDWADRLSLPVPAVMQDPNVVNNLKYQMIDSYVSQEAVWGLPFAFGKSDEVFWKQTWSRNIALRATITASSQNTKFFQGAANVADSIVDGYRDQNNDGISEGNSQAEWVTAGEREGAWVQLDWTQPYTINKVVLYDRPNPSDQVLSGTLSFSDGSTVSVGALPNDGSKYEVDFAAREVSWARFTVDSVSAATANVGLAEMEVWTAAPPADNQPPFFTRGPTASALTGGMSSTLAAPAYDREGDPITWTWQSQLGATITGSGDTVTYTPPYGVGGTDTVTVTISDGINPPITAKFALALDENNITYLAQVTASSETPSTGQLAIKAVDGVIDGYPGDYTKEWATNGQGAGAWIRLTWPTAYTVDQIVLYDRKNTTEQILSGTLTFSDGSSVAVGALDNLGAPKTVAFTPRTITWVQFTINSVKAGSHNIGLMEIEVFGAAGD